MLSPGRGASLALAQVWCRAASWRQSPLACVTACSRLVLFLFLLLFLFLFLFLPKLCSGHDTAYAATTRRRGTSPARC